ncbi:MAG TPA: D-alanine--D-alanine ligase family protein [Patescibacteria group bacterium]|nr:D-alanine--D-alanine ligase family protein [Patescibacteria group bacterium]
MKKVAVLFGGKSVEHEVSVITGHQIMAALEVAGYTVLPVYITKAGRWFAGTALNNIQQYKVQGFEPENVKGVYRVAMSTDPNVKKFHVYYKNRWQVLFRSGRSNHIWADVFFPALHGGAGENGELQGLFEMANVPYVGCGVEAAALGMDKYLQKQIFKALGIPALDAHLFFRGEWEASRDHVCEKIESVFSYPVIVKPNDGGSTIGVTVAKDRTGLVSALELAFSLGERTIVEKALVDFEEVNISVRSYPLSTSVAEQPLGKGEVLSFEDKYKRGGKGTKGSKSDGAGMASLDRLIPAPLSDERLAQVQEWATKAYTALGLKGVVRVDFLVDKATNQLYINEPNTLPGSLAFYLWEHTGVRFDKLVTDLVTEAEVIHTEKQKTTTNFEANLLV